MARAQPDVPPSPTPAETFLAPLQRLATRDPSVETAVFWAQGGWPAAPTEMLEAEETAFYAEGLMEEGFSLHWRILAADPGPDRPDHVRLYVAEEAGLPPPAIGPGWRVLAAADWGGA